MFEIVEAIHKALRTESTLAFVLVIAALFAVVGGAAAWVVDAGYKNSPEYRKEHEPPDNGRKLAEWQRVKMIAILSRFPGQHVAILASAGDETLAYATQFRAVFKDSNWKVEGPKPAPEDQPAIDLQVSVSTKFLGTESAMPPGFQALKGALDFVGLKCRSKFIMDPDVSTNVVFLWVGAKSPDGMTPDNYPPLETHGRY
jgi:hypothetical protein